MAQKNIHPHAQPIELRGNNKVAFLLIHGYTGSPDDFNGLPAFLHEHYGVSVFVPLLPGHGTRVEDLRGLTKDDFIKVAEDSLEPLFSAYDRVIIGGHSFGGQVALHVGARRPVHGVFVTALPFKLFFPLSIPGFYEFWHKLSLKEFLKKRLSMEERQRRVISFSYDRMPAYGLKLLCDMNKELRNLLPKLKSPLLAIFFKGDPIAHKGGGDEIKKLAGCEISKTVIMDNMGHGLFFTKDSYKIHQEIVQFFNIV